MRDNWAVSCVCMFIWQLQPVLGGLQPSVPRHATPPRHTIHQGTRRLVCLASSPSFIFLSFICSSTSPQGCGIHTGGSPARFRSLRSKAKRKSCDLLTAVDGCT
ncbi:hypothetical protein LZ32DRAFT_226518 [Colletotrichum eremochloae]|nr:hypothetical protein LZ32DRAFT_226518 [Colletotrichum eremochloae]